jgi:hypothetical protein
VDRWDERLRGVTKKAEDKIDESIAEMRARQAKQARAVQAKALQKVIEDGFRNTRDAADAYFKAVQEERVVRGSLIKKYIREGVRGTDRLYTDEEGNVSPFDLMFFASLHSGRAKDVALKALGQLRQELAPNRTGKDAGPSRKLDVISLD